MSHIDAGSRLAVCMAVILCSLAPCQEGALPKAVTTSKDPKVQQALKRFRDVEMRQRLRRDGVIEKAQAEYDAAIKRARKALMKSVRRHLPDLGAKSEPSGDDAKAEGVVRFRMLDKKTGAPLRTMRVALINSKGIVHMGQADERGLVSIELNPGAGKYTLYCAGEGARAIVRRNVTPKALQRIMLERLADGGSALMADSDGEIPVLSGRLQWIADRSVKPTSFYVYATNIAIDGGRDQPVDYKVGDWLEMEDARAARARMRAVDHPSKGSAVLVEYERLKKR